MRATYEPIGGEAAKFITCVRSIVISQVKDKVKRESGPFLFGRCESTGQQRTYDSNYQEKHSYGSMQ